MPKKARYAVTLPILMGVFGAFGARPAVAADRACSSIAVEADNAVIRRWPELPESVHAAFDARDDIDACAHVKLTSKDAAIVVTVILPDGRSASRSISRRQDVVPMLEALLLVPHHPTPALPSTSTLPLPSTSTSPLPSTSTSTPVPADALDPSTSSIVPAASARHDPGDARPAVSDRTTTKPFLEQAPPHSGREDSPNRLRIELSAFTGARAGDGCTSVGFGALSFLDVAGWLVGFGARLDSYGVAGGPENAAMELAVLGGRRFRFRTMAMDLIGGLAMIPQRSTVVKSDPTGRKEEFSSGAVPRLLFGTRLNFGARSVMRTFVGVEGGLGGSGSVGYVGSDPKESGRLPIWTVGFVLGATVGTL